MVCFIIVLNLRDPKPMLKNIVYGPQAQPLQTEDAEDDAEQNEMEEEEMGGMEMSETHFDFNGFIVDFAHIEVLKSYAILLRDFAENSDAVNHCVVKMLHRLCHDLGFVGMLFQASIFKSFSSLINGPYARLPRFKELAKFAGFVVRQFTTVAKINKKIFVDMLFWKTKSEALAITGGYDFSSNSKVKSTWTEDQEDELLGLYEKFKDARDPELDTADLILAELTSNHTRIQVLKELRRQGLIKSAADLKKKGRSHAWSEQEVQELTDAFDLYKDSHHPIADIMTALSNDRSQQNVIKKILELGLVADKAELKKKRKGGAQGRGGRRKKRGGSEDEEDDSEGERLFPTTRRGRRTNQSDESSSGSSEEDDEDDNDEDEAESHTDKTVLECVIKLVEQGYEEPIAWIIRSLRNTAEDRDEGICIPTPIVPLSEENETAMEDESFLVFLRKIGITAPANQQELFWRIPAEFSAADLTTIAKGLELTLSGQLKYADDIQEIVNQRFPKQTVLSNQRRKYRGGGNQKRKEKKHQARAKARENKQNRKPESREGKANSSLERTLENNDDQSSDGKKSLFSDGWGGVGLVAQWLVSPP
ncbi:timeless-like protein [Plakobranchus ocellatus]|uniref:Timeless-like protein n=1 Tax=Plakobranchus ocellatus TaxID=259542 RepID=A0AAV3ZJW9_9GAST|nr:timeless-like protein [Plakobranchus ocellatus]